MLAQLFCDRYWLFWHPDPRCEGNSCFPRTAIKVLFAYSPPFALEHPQSPQH